jgi:hypothetical protein
MFFSVFTVILILVSIYSALTIKKIDPIPTNQQTTSSTQTEPTSTESQIPQLATTTIFEPQRPIPQIPKPTVIIETPKQILLHNMKLTFSEEFDFGESTCQSNVSISTSKISRTRQPSHPKIGSKILLFSSVYSQFRACFMKIPSTIMRGRIIMIGIRFKYFMKKSTT